MELASALFVMETNMIEILDGELDALCSIPVIGKRRHSCSRRVLVSLSAGPRELCWLARTQNISQEGMAVMSCRPFDLGLWLTFDVETSGPTGNRRLEGLVIHATPRDQDQWLVGCKLATVLTASELQEFLNEV
jgi:PilZ domain